MARILDTNMRVVKGNCIRVANLDKEFEIGRSEEPDVFVCIQVENETGKEEYPILLTQDEFKSITRAQFDDMNDMVFGRIYNRFIDNNNYFCVKLRDNNSEVFVGVFDIGKWAEYYKCALRHGRSCTSKNLLVDLFD